MTDRSSTRPLAKTDPARKIRWGIVGTGTIAAAFAGDIAHVQNAELAAVCSRTLASAQTFSGLFGNPKCFDDIGKLAEDPDIDVVYLATPNSAHAGQARTLLEAGKSLLVEKPLVTTAGEARLLADLAASRDLFLMEALWTVFLPAFAEVRTLLADGTLGTITGVDAELAFAKAFDPQSRFFADELGGGSLLDLGIYAIAVALHLFGNPEKVEGGWKAAPTGVDMSATVKLSYPGFAARLSCGFDRNGANRFVIRGTKATLVIEAPFLKASRVVIVRNGAAIALATGQGNGLVQRAMGRLARVMPGSRTVEATFPGNGLQFEITAVGEALLSGSRQHALMPVSASIAALEIIEKIRSLPPL